MAEHPGLFGRVGEGIGTLFGGRADPSLSPEANRRATSDALVQAGLATLLTEGPGGVSPTTIQAISTGIAAGRGAGAATREVETEKQQLAQLKAAIDEGGLDTRDLFLRALSIGDIDSANLLGQLARSEGSRAGQVTRFKEGIGPEGLGIYRVDSAGNLLNKILDVRPRGAAGQRFGEPQVFTRARDNKQIMGVWDAEANDGRGGVVELPELLPNQSLAQQTQAGLGQVGLVANTALEEVADALGTITTDFASDSNSFFISTVANFVATDEQQIAMSLADTFLNVTVRWLSGAQMTDQERTNYRRAMIPRAGDREFAKRVKSLMRANIAEAMSKGVWQGTPVINEDGTVSADTSNVVAWTAMAQVEAIQQVIAEMEAEGLGGPSLQDIIDAGGRPN
ncbi:MAG: hypothetical protein V3S55_10150 [Nitrospiraceae bacterium]